LQALAGKGAEREQQMIAKVCQHFPQLCPPEVVQTVKTKAGVVDSSTLSWSDFASASY
jgi:hypothetical protein